MSIHAPERHAVRVNTADTKNVGDLLTTPQALLLGEGLTNFTPGEIEALQALMKWTHDFIMKPHPQLGRTGAVCPFVKPALRQANVYLTVCRPNQPVTANTLVEDVLPFRDVFLNLPGAGQPEARLHTLMIALPDLTDETASRIMEPVHQALKTELLPDKILIGQFYPSCPVPATWNKSFFPLQSPVPMFVLRYLIETDWRFLAGHPEWESAYREYYPETTTPLRP